MTLDPHLAGLLQTLQKGPRIVDGTVEQARAGLRALTCDTRPPGTETSVSEVRELSVPGADGDLPARLYLPEEAETKPLLVYFHGGGFVVGDLDTHDEFCRRLCSGADTGVLSVAYRLAPEHPFPAGIDNALASVRWAAEQAGTLGAGPGLFVGGDSAGGTLAAVTAQTLPDLLAGQVLIYPLTDESEEHPSRRDNGTGYFLETETMAWFGGHYVSGDERATRTDARISPLLAESLAGLPSAVVVTAEFDPLRDEGDRYAERLGEAGVTVDHLAVPGMIHGFIGMDRLSPGADAATAEIVRRVRNLIHG